MSPFGIAERKQVGVQGYDCRGGVVERYALAVDHGVDGLRTFAVGSVTHCLRIGPAAWKHGPFGYLSRKSQPQSSVPSQLLPTVETATCTGPTAEP